MSLRTDTIYTDDTSAWIEREITDNKGGDLSWTPTVAVDAGAYSITAAWQGVAVTTTASDGTTKTKRVLRVPLTGLATGTHRLYLQNPNGPDWSLGSVYVTVRR